MIIAKYGKQEKSNRVMLVIMNSGKKIIHNIIGHSKLSLIYKMPLCHYEIVHIIPRFVETIIYIQQVSEQFLREGLSPVQLVLEKTPFL